MRGRTGAGAGRIGAIEDMTGRAVWGIWDGAGRIGRSAAAMAAELAETTPPSPSPRKSPTRVSTNWLIEIPLVSQNAFRRS